VTTPLKELLASIPFDLVPLEQYLEDQFDCPLLAHISEDVLTDALETVLENRKQRWAS
jgi:hypothetical protein